VPSEFGLPLLAADEDRKPQLAHLHDPPHRKHHQSLLRWQSLFNHHHHLQSWRMKNRTNRYFWTQAQPEIAPATENQ